MKHAFGVFLGFALAQSLAWGNAYTFTPSDAKLGNLDHNYAYAWRINSPGLKTDLANGMVIETAVLEISGIRDWKREPDILYINLFDRSTSFASDVARSWDGEGGGNYFQGRGVFVGQWSDTDGPYGLSAPGHDLAFNLGALGFLDELTTYAADGLFVFGFDPDCHYYNNGISFKITTGGTSVPDGGVTLILLGGALLGLYGLRRKVQA